MKVKCEKCNKPIRKNRILLNHYITEKGIVDELNGYHCLNCKMIVRFDIK